MARYAALDEGKRFSAEVLDDVRESLAGTDFEAVRTIAVAGSFGRLEASRASDADFIIIPHDDVPVESRPEIEGAVIARLTELFEKHGIPAPNPEGVFASPRTLGELLPPEEEGGFGTPDEPADLMGKRQLLLLESRPLWNDSEYDGVIDAIFERYSRYVLQDTTKEHLYLLNDLIRYFRYICVNYQSTFGKQYEKWAIRNTKLRHSRLLMYAGLLVLLGEASRYTGREKLTIVRDGLRMTPMERIESVFAANDDYAFFKIAGLYNAFLMRLSDPNIRVQLNALEYEDRYDNPYFATLKANSDAFQSELTQFIFRRHGTWSDRFFEYLVF